MQVNYFEADCMMSQYVNDIPQLICFTGINTSLYQTPASQSVRGQLLRGFGCQQDIGTYAQHQRLSRDNNSGSDGLATMKIRLLNFR